MQRESGAIHSRKTLFNQKLHDYDELQQHDSGNNRPPQHRVPLLGDGKEILRQSVCQELLRQGLRHLLQGNGSRQPNNSRTPKGDDRVPLKPNRH